MFFNLLNDNIALMLVFIVVSFIAIMYKLKRKNIVFFLFLLLALLTFNRTLVILSCLTIAIFSKKRISNYIICLIALLFFLLKTEIASNNGRWFILKNSASLIAQHPMGIGFGNFKKEYLLQQARYFKTNGIASKEALLADNTQYALNDYVQFTVELGFIPVLLFIVFNAILLLFAFKKNSNTNKVTLLASSVGVIQILVSAVTYFTFHNWYFVALYTFLVLLILLQLLNFKKALIYLIFFMSLFSFLIYQHYLNFKEGIKVRDAQMLSIAGYKLLADSLFNKISKKEQNEAYFMALGQHQFRFGYTDSAISLMSQSAKIFADNELYMLLGDYHLAKANYFTAEHYYTTAFFMVPNRFRVREKLVNFYKQIGNTEKEKYWLNSIVDFPEKIPSNITKQIKANAKIRLSTLN